MNFGLLFPGSKIFPQRISHTLCDSAAKFGSIRGLAIETYCSNFVNVNFVILTKMPFRLWAPMSPRNHVLDGCPDPPWIEAIF